MFYLFPMMNMLANDRPEPPTIYSLLDAYVNFGKEEKTKIADLAEQGRSMFFDFDYPLSTNINRSEFEKTILNHFMMRRIGYETVTAFKIALNVKLVEIMPAYNKLFNAFESWEIFTDGEVTTRSAESTSENENHITNNGNVESTSDQRFSDTPQNQIQDVKDGKYVTDYNYNTDRNSSDTQTDTDGSDHNVTTETITRTPADKMKNYAEFLQAKQNIYTMIFKDLDVLFYQIV